MLQVQNKCSTVMKTIKNGGLVEYNDLCLRYHREDQHLPEMPIYVVFFYGFFW